MKKLFILLNLFIISQLLSAQTQIIAHRGFWKTSGSAQNSISALIKADSIAVYGSEMDAKEMNCSFLDVR